MKPWEYKRKLVQSFSLLGEKDFQANEPESHNFTEQSRPKTGSVGDADDLTSGEASKAFTPEKVKVSDQAQNSPLPSLNKGSDETADKAHYQPAGETTAESSEGVPTKDTLADVPKSAQKVYETYGNLLVALPPILLLNLMAWVAKFHELRLEHPTGLTLDARPEDVRDAVKLHPWGVVYDFERYLLLSWGDVPAWVLIDKRDLETGELLIPEAVAA